jgi:1-acyl-sn-glycerol-3-phosphate acyltransferase
MRFRAIRRAVALAITLIGCMFRYWLLRLRHPLTPLSDAQRGEWSQSCGRPLMDALGIRFSVEGEPPARGLLVSNHLSYIDVLIYGAILPCCFVAKDEIRRWPFFGRMARAGGTLFIKRTSRTSAEAVTAQIAERLKGPVPVLFFPEGTSTDGSEVLRFRSRFFTPAIAARVPVTACSVRYFMEDGTPERELCWFGDASLLPHVWKVLSSAGFSAQVCFGEPRVYSDRRRAADETQAEVEAMRAGQVLTLQ